MITGSTVTGTAGGILGEKNLAIEAGDTVNIIDTETAIGNLAVSAAGEDITFTESAGLTLDDVDGIQGVAGKDVALTATTGDLTVSDGGAGNDIDASGTVTLTASADNATLTIAAGADVEGTSAAHTYTADKMDISGTVTATNQIVTLKSSTAADTIDLGSLVDTTVDTLELSSAELAAITATTLRVGAADAGAITVSTDVTPSNVTNLHLITGGGVTGTNGGIVVKSLAVEAEGAVTITDSTTDVGTGTLAIYTSTGDIQFTDADSFTVGTVDGVSGVDTDNGSVTLIATTGSIGLDDIDNVVSAGGGGDVTLTATAGNITVADTTTAGIEILNTGSVSLTGAAIGATNPIDLSGATALTITDLNGAGNNIQVREQSASTIAATTITVPTATSDTIDIDYFGSNVVDIDNGHALADITLSNATTSSFTYTATAGNVTATQVNTADKDLTIDAQSGTLALVNLDTTSGNMDIDASGNITVTADGGVTTTGGNVNINSSGGYIRNSAASNGTADIVTAGGDIALEASTGIADSAGTAGLDIDSGGGAVTLTGDGTGNILVDYVSTDADAVTMTATHTGTGDVTYDSLSTGLLEVATSSTSGGNLSIHAASSNINVSGAMTAAGGGVSLIADTGKVYTDDGSGMLNVAITGYSDDNTTTDIGVGLPLDNDKKAAIVIISKDDLDLGTGATLTAMGSYNSQVDDRTGVYFVPDGDPIDAAIYLGSKKGNVYIDSQANITSGGTMVIVAYDKVEDFGPEFVLSLTKNTIDRLEAGSHKAVDLQTAINLSLLPHAAAPSDIANGAFVQGGGVYVLRGLKGVLGLALLSLTAPVPLAVPMPLEPEVQGEVDEPDMEALMALLDELGIGVQPFLARAYRPSLNTDLSLFKAAEKLLRLGPILEDADGTRIAALVPLIRGISETPVPVEEQITSFVQELARQELAGQWINALVEYAAILNSDIGLPADDSVARVMVRYGGKLTGPAESLFVEEYLAQSFTD